MSLKQPLLLLVLRTVAWIGLALVLLALAQWASLPLASSDVFWQVRTGEVALETGTVPHTDPFSYTVEGTRWNNHEWGFEVLAALLRRALGWGGLRLFVLSMVLGTAVGLAWVVGRRAGAAWALVTVTLFGLFAQYKMMPVPQLASMALLLGALHFFRGERLARSNLGSGLLAVTMLVWGNLTAESLMFLPFFLLDQALVRWAPRPGSEEELPPLHWHLSRMGFVCVAPLITPPWSSTLEYLLVGTSVNREVNKEFTPLWAPAAAVTPWVKQVAIALVAAYLLWALASLLRSTDRRRALRLALPGLLAVLLAVAFERNLFLLLLPAARLGIELKRWAVNAPQRMGMALGALVGALVIFIQFAISSHWSPSRALTLVTSGAYYRRHLNPSLVPYACVNALGSDPRPRRIFTLRMWASYVIWRLPWSRVFIDGRNREFPLALHRAGQHVWAGGPMTLPILDESGTDTVIATPEWGNSPNVAPGPWRMTLRGPGCAVYERVQ